MYRQCFAVFLVALFCVELTTVVHADDKRLKPRPNVVLFLIDDLGWADLGCYGSKFHRTPSLDAMAAEGVRFTQAYAACPVCSPTRASIMTGQWPARLQLTDWLPGRGDLPSQMLARPAFRQQLPLEETTLAESLRSAGYATAIVGKWHLGGKGFDPSQQGFDVNIGGAEIGSPLSYFAPYSRQGRFMPGLETAPEGEYLTDRLTSEAVTFIEANAERPFFLYVPHYGVHTPMKGKESLVAQYAKDGKPGTQNNPIYAAMLESVDESVSRVLKTLDRLKLDDRTLVLFTSDNGGLATLEGPNTPATNNGPLREGKGHLYEGGIRVPLLLRWPSKLAGGKLVDTPVCSTDLRSTILAACGVENTSKDDGFNLWPMLSEEKSLPTRDLYWHYPHYSNQLGKPGGAIRSGDFKLIEFYESGRRELFDLSKDARETRNLAAEKPELVAELAKKLDAWRVAVGAQMMTPNPNYMPNPPAKDGTIEMQARSAQVHGLQLRFEPLPHKNTLGFWTRTDDWASWQFTVTQPGRYEVEALVGCGKGSGGSEVVFETGGQKLPLRVEETGGFQNFEVRKLGVVNLANAGRHELTVRALSKPGVAVMDLRQVTLRPVKE